MSLYLLAVFSGLLASFYFYGHIRFFEKRQGMHKVYELAPESHQQKKAVSMGGIAFLILSSITLFAGSMTGLGLFSSPAFIWLQGLAFCFAGLGLVDDSLSLLRQKNQGLRTVEKFLLQLILATVFMAIFAIWIEPQSLAVFVLSVFVIVGSSNATNLTDGVDGLMGSLAYVTLAAFLALFMGFLGPEVLQNKAFLNDFFVFLACLVPVLAAFLYFNSHPATLFMGDTGSLWLGALFAGLAIIYGNVFVLIPIAAPYILETLCVIVQVAYYKKSKTRIFLMSPFHHHLELMGLNEKQVLFVFHLFYVLILLLYFCLSAAG